MVVRLSALMLLVTAMPAYAASPRPSVLHVASVEALTSPSSSIATPAKSAAAEGLVPAPMPNPDIDPPHGESRRDAELQPALLSEKLEFQGNGFAPASNSDYGLDQRTKPAAGLALSVPVK